jgi:hypothetical protein
MYLFILYTIGSTPGIRSKALDVKCLEILKSDSNLLNDF